LDSERQYYDRDKYVELVLDVAETVLGIFGFDRGNLGLGGKPRNFLEELKLDRSQEILGELESLGSSHES
jgi:hypothetical protein